MWSCVRLAEPWGARAAAALPSWSAPWYQWKGCRVLDKVPLSDLSIPQTWRDPRCIANEIKVISPRPPFPAACPTTKRICQHRVGLIA